MGVAKARSVVRIEYAETFGKNYKVLTTRIELSCILRIMQTNIVTLPLAFLFSIFLMASSHGNPEKNEKVIASVTQVMHQNNSVGDKVRLLLTLHEPSRLGGFKFLVVTESSDRVKTRQGFPVGSLQMLALPSKTVKELEAQIEAHESVEKTLDKGVHPARISQAFLLPSVRLSEVSASLVEIFIDMETVEKSGVPQIRKR